MKKSPLFYLGNLLIILSILLVIFVYYPVALMYLLPPKIRDVSNDQGFYLTVGKIHAQAPVIKDVDPFNKEAYLSALKRGVAQSNTSKMPGEKGTVFIFAHSSGTPWDVNRYNTVFLRLGELKTNDEVKINLKGKTYKYKVYDKKIVDPADIKYLSNQGNILIIQTCYPIGTSFKRLLVFTKPA